MSSYSWPPDEMYLILEEVRFARLCRTKGPEHDLFVDRGKLLARTRKEARNHREAVRDARGIRRTQAERLPRACQPVEAFRVCAKPPFRPEHVRQMLLGERNLRLNRQHDVAQVGRVAAIGRHAGQDPRASLLVHETARAVDRIHDHDKRCNCGLRASRQHDAAPGQPFRYEHDRRARRDLTLEELDERVLAHPVDRVDRVSLVVCRDAGEIVEARALSRRDDRMPDFVVQGAQRRQQIGSRHGVASL